MSAFANQSQVVNVFATNEESRELPVTVIAYSEASGVIEILVEANQVVDDVCNYFNGSWVDTGLKIYCTFNGASTVCIAHKIVKAVCGINGAIKLYIEGDINNATKKLLTTGADIWKMVRRRDGGVELVKSGMCSIR